MFTIPSFFSSSLPVFSKSAARQLVTLSPVDVHDVELRKGKRDRALKHLLRLNHVNHAVLFHDLSFHNHMPHILGSAYLLNAGEDHLGRIYEAESETLDKWTNSPGEISKHDWRDYLGERQYQRAYLDFFEDELVHNGYNWQKVLKIYLFEGQKPLINGVISGLGHPLIHLGYAFELSSRDLAMEALTLATTSYNFMHKYLDDESYSKKSPFNTSSLLNILDRIADDTRFDGVVDHKGSDVSDLFRDHEELILEYWNSWYLPQPTEQFKDSQYAAALLLIGTQKAKNQLYDFFLAHVLTTSHAVRILLPLIPAERQVPLVRQWWLLTLAVYITQLRPRIHTESVVGYDIGDKGWDWVKRRAIEGEWTTDAHFVKVLRALEQASRTWGDDQKVYLKSAVRFGEQFGGWSGFGPLGEASF